MDIQITPKKTEGLDRTLEVSVPVEEVRNAEERAARRYATQVRLPGFRPGKAPPAMVRKRFAQAIRQEAMEQLLQEAYQEVIQREKINPVAGCLPIIIQIPVFLAFYWVLLESVEMRQAPFMGWINDLSSRDPWFILPALMAGAMFVQYKLNPTPPDPVQAKIFMFMPLVMSVMFAFFPAGLVLYWVTNTVLSIAQQWNINRRIEARRKN